MTIFAMSIAVNSGAALLVKANSAIPIVLAGLGLTILSFAYQSLARSLIYLARSVGLFVSVSNLSGEAGFLLNM